jgi:hypothetical protein
MRTKNEEERDRALDRAVDEVAAERGRDGFTTDELVARFLATYRMPAVDPTVPRYEQVTELPELGVAVHTSGARYGQTDDGTLVELMAPCVAVHRLLSAGSQGTDLEPLYVRFILGDPDDAALAARHSEVVDRVRVGTIRHDGTHHSLDDDNVRAQVWTFMDETLAAMIASGEAERLAAEEEAARAAAWAAAEAGDAKASYMPCLYPVLEDCTYDAFDFDQDEWTRARVSYMAEEVAETYLATRQRREGEQPE